MLPFAPDNIQNQRPTTISTLPLTTERVTAVRRNCARISLIFTQPPALTDVFHLRVSTGSWPSLSTGSTYTASDIAVMSVLLAPVGDTSSQGRRSDEISP